MLLSNGGGAAAIWIRDNGGGAAAIWIWNNVGVAAIWIWDNPAAAVILRDYLIGNYTFTVAVAAVVAAAGVAILCDWLKVDGENAGVGPGHGIISPVQEDAIGDGILLSDESVGLGPEPGNIGHAQEDAMGDGILEPFAAAAAAIEWNGGIVDGENAGVILGHAQEDEIGDEIPDILAAENAGVIPGHAQEDGPDILAVLGLGWNVNGVEAGAGNVGLGQNPEFARLGLYQLGWNNDPPAEEIEMDHQDIKDLFDE